MLRFYQVLFLCAIIPIIIATHFRGAIFTWEPDGTQNGVLIHFRISWRRSYSDHYFCNASTITSRALIGQDKLSCMKGCKGTVGSLMFQCTDYDATEDWTTGRYTVQYNASSPSFSFGYSSCCWISTLDRGANGAWSLKVTVDTTRRADTGRINRSPTVEMVPVLVLLEGCNYIINFPVGDVDGDVVRCRWADGSEECNDICGQFPGADLNEKTCTMSYKATQRGIFAVALQIEDFASTESTVPFSSIPLQFLVRVESCKGCTCEREPEFVDPTPKPNACFSLDVGDMFNVTLKARSKWRLRGLTTISPIGMEKSYELHSSDSDWHYLAIQLTWVPEQSDTGKDHNFCFYATDSHLGLSTMVQCIRIPVSVKEPAPLRVERIGLSNTWVIVIDQTFQRPTNSALIFVYDTESNEALVSVDVATSSDVLYDPINRRITVTFLYTFDIDTKYHVSIPSGLVKGYVSCGAVSKAINDSAFWPIELDCGEIIVPNGKVTPPNATAYPSTVTYACDPGYYLVGDISRTCQPNRSWTGENSTCEPKDCGFPPDVLNGNIVAPKTTYSEYATYECLRRYHIIGNNRRVCEETGLWSQNIPVCELIDCGTIDAPDNGYVTFSQTYVDDTATFNCSHEYQLVGSSISVCQNDGTWSNLQTSCQQSVCEVIHPPENGKLSVSSARYKATAIVSCNVGYELVGVSELICQENDEWSADFPSCEPKDCRLPSNITNGVVICNSTTYLSECSYACYPGHSLVGEPVIFCTEEGNWSDHSTLLNIGRHFVYMELGPITNLTPSLEAEQISLINLVQVHS
ncbi:uncharacterized protein LOC128227619 isoform X2 [Mya arenaria]|uniref:uncharacterized protein LOC128227619 isoform X2 n=1 Tax=Mya arenaria TaxID=6604 RepID=UPI0022E2789D|nr:uncharacterized protein LOC128227619 isoform X2 [Mya arenaria]